MKHFREAKQSFSDKLADKLSSGTVSAKDWWSTLKSFILPETKSPIPALEVNNMIHTNEYDKQTFLITTSKVIQYSMTLNAILPGLPQPPLESQLSQIISTPQEIKSILQNLPLGKASGLNGLSNRILHELNLLMRFMWPIVLSSISQCKVV